MRNFAERLKFLMENYQLDAAALAARLQIQKSAVSHLLSGRNKPRFDILARFAMAFPELNMRWLLTGHGEPFSPTPSLPEKHSNDLFSQAGIPLDEPQTEKNFIQQTNSELPYTTASEQTNFNKIVQDLPEENMHNFFELIKIYPDGTFEVLIRRKPKA